MFFFFAFLTWVSCFAERSLESRLVSSVFLTLFAGGFLQLLWHHQRWWQTNASSLETFQKYIWTNRLCNTFILRDIEGALIYTTTILEPNITLNIRLSGPFRYRFQPNLARRSRFWSVKFLGDPWFLFNSTLEYLPNWPMVQNCCHGVLPFEMVLIH